MNSLHIIGPLLIALAANASARIWLEKQRGAPTDNTQRQQSMRTNMLSVLVALPLLLLFAIGPGLAALLAVAALVIWFAVNEGRRLIKLGFKQAPAGTQLGIAALWLIQTLGIGYSCIYYAIIARSG